MSAVQILALLLAMSVATIIGMITALIERHNGTPLGGAILTGAGAAAMCLTIYFAAVSAYT